jgi:serine/threonine-protein kinase
MNLRYALVLLNAGVIVGSYQISHVIGYGGFGAVYAAEDTRTRQDVALKETFDTSSTRAFQSEFNVLHRLNHDHLPHYYEMFEEQGNGYLVMELIPGQSLLDVLQRRQGQSLAEAQVMGYAIQICDALIYLHAQTPTLIHRDIKPANIRLTPEGLIKLVDFGLLKQGTDKTGKSRMGLTPAYAPLEQWGDTGMHTTPQSDIYSLGATLYHLLTGQPPLTVTDRIADEDIFLSPHQINPRVSPHVSDAIMKALSVQPKHRFVDALSFKQALIYANTPALQTTIPGTQQKSDPIHTNADSNYISEPTRVMLEPTYVSEPTQVMSEPTYVSEPTRVMTSQPTTNHRWWIVVVVALLLLAGGGAWWATRGNTTASSAIVTTTAAADYYKQGIELYKEGNYEEAIEQFTSAITLDPNSPQAYSGRGLVYYRLAKYDKAIQDYDQAIALDETNATWYNDRGLAYNKQGNNDQAIENYDQAIALNKTFTDAYINRGSAYKTMGKHDQAINDYNTAIALDSSNPVAYNNRGGAYKAKGDYDKAIADYTQAIALDGNYAVAYYNRGGAYLAQEKKEQATADFEQCKKLAEASGDTNLQKLAEEQLQQSP